MAGTRDVERIAHLRDAIAEAGLDCLLCALPANVLLLTGYWPVVGTAVGVATRDGAIGLAVPRDELQLAQLGWADPCLTFQGGSLEVIPSPVEAVTGTVVHLLDVLGVRDGRIGWERGALYEPASYVAFNCYGMALVEAVGERLPKLEFAPAERVLLELRALPTARERDRIRAACRVAEQAFREGARQLRAGMTEAQAAAGFRDPLFELGLASTGAQRAGGFVFCMSGPRSAEAGRSYARTGSRTLAAGDPVLVHCNSYLDGYWTDITRTFVLGDPTARQSVLYEAVLAARASALDAIRPGATAREVDRAARALLAARGLGEGFTHGTGHGVGFAAIDHRALPRIHPASPDILREGMIFNVEPAVYLAGECGIRHCDVVAVTETGAELLTPFQAEPGALALGSLPAAMR